MREENEDRRALIQITSERRSEKQKMKRLRIRDHFRLWIALNCPQLQNFDRKQDTARVASRYWDPAHADGLLTNCRSLPLPWMVPLMQNRCWHVYVPLKAPNFSPNLLEWSFWSRSWGQKRAIWNITRFSGAYSGDQLQPLSPRLASDRIPQIARVRMERGIRIEMETKSCEGPSLR